MSAPLVALCVIPHRIVTFENRLVQVRSAITRAAQRGARLICFPEYLGQQRVKETIAAKHRQMFSTAEPFPGGRLETLVRESCARHRIGALFNMGAKEDGKGFNVTVSVSSRGKVLGTYRKTHLAHTESDQDRMTPGNELHLTPTEIGPAGIIVCCEITFPEIARSYQALGASFLYDPSAGNSDEYFTMARARACETYTPMIFSSYQVYPGRTGCAGAFISSTGAVLKRRTYRPGLIHERLELSPFKCSPYWNRSRPRVDMRRYTWKRRRPSLYHVFPEAACCAEGS